MIVYNVVISKTAEKELYNLPAKAVEEIVPAVMSLSENPRPNGCKKLKGYANFWRIRIGDYRVIYSIEDVIQLVDVRSVGHRKDIYE